MTTSLEAHTAAPSLSSGIPLWGIILLICFMGFGGLVLGVCCCRRCNLPGEVGGSHGRCWHSLLFPHFLLRFFRQKGPPLCLPNLWVFLAWL